MLDKLLRNNGVLVRTQSEQYRNISQYLCRSCAKWHKKGTKNYQTWTMIDTPCVNICKIDPVSGLCIGCARNLIEIAGWREFTDQERRQITDDLPQRLRTDLRRNQQ